MLKKILILVFCLISLSGCSKKADIDEITFSSWGSVTEVRILKQVISDFEKENPKIKVNFLHIPQNYFQKLHLLFASNTAPDVLFINNLYLPLYANFLENLSGVIKKEDFYPQAIEALSIKDELLAIPRDLSNLVIYVNTDILQIERNMTMQELFESFKLLKEKNIWGIGIEEDFFWLLPILNYYGEDVTTPLDIKTSKALNFYKKMRDEYGYLPTKSQIGSSTLAQMFLDGKIAMYLSGRWMYPKILEKSKFNWEVISFPNGQIPLPCDASGWAISKNSKKKDAAILFVKYLSSPKSSQYFANTGLVVPARITTSQMLNNKLHNEKIFLEVIKTSKKIPFSKNYKKLVDKFNNNL